MTDKENKSAMEMFEELGYKYSANDYWIYYKNSESESISFHLQTKSFYKLCDGDMARTINMSELKLINKQISELGW